MFKNELETFFSRLVNLRTYVSAAENVTRVLGFETETMKTVTSGEETGKGDFGNWGGKLQEIWTHLKRIKAFRSSLMAVEIIIWAAGTAIMEASTGIGSRVISDLKFAKLRLTSRL